MTTKRNVCFKNFRTLIPFSDKSNQTICIEEGLIKVRDLDTIEIDSYDSIDCENLFLLPGFIDCHVHISMNSSSNPFAEFDKDLSETVYDGLENLKKTIAGGFTTIRDLGALLEPITEIKRYCKPNQSLPDLLISGSALCPTKGHGDKIALTHSNEIELFNNLETLRNHKVDVIKVMASGGVISDNSTLNDIQFSDNELIIINNFSKRYNIPVAAHAQSILSVKSCLNTGVKSIEHGVNLDEECIALMLKNNAYLIPTLSAPYHMVNNLKDLKLDNSIIEKLIAAKEIHQQSILNAYKQGVKIALGTDAGTPFNYHGNNIHELNLMKNLGMSIEDVITSASKNASEILGISRELGEISQDKKADLVVMNIEENKNISFDKNNIKYVFKNGKIIS